MRERNSGELLEEVFGRTYGRSLSRDQRMPKLANMTVVEALDAGEEPRVVWNVLCDQMEVPDSSVGATIITRRPCPPSDTAGLRSR